MRGAAWAVAAAAAAVRMIAGVVDWAGGYSWTGAASVAKASDVSSCHGQSPVGAPWCSGNVGNDEGGVSSMLDAFQRRARETLRDVGMRNVEVEKSETLSRFGVQPITSKDAARCSGCRLDTFYMDTNHFQR